MLTNLASFSYRHRFLVTLSWIAVAAAIGFLGVTRGAPNQNTFTGGDSPSQRAQQLLATHFPEYGGVSALTLAVHADRGLDDPGVRAAVTAAVDRLRAAPHVTAVVSPYDAPGQISADRRTAFGAAQLDVGSNDMPAQETLNLISGVRAATGDGLEFALGGEAVNAAETPGGGGSDAAGAIAAMVVLLVAFGSLLAMVLPLITAIFAITIGLTGGMLINHVIPTPGFGPILATLNGLGVGVDYAMFIVTRYRAALSAGRTPEEAAVHATATAGRAVLFAGATVVVGLLGLVLIDRVVCGGVAVSCALTVTLTMAAAVTLLPALLGFVRRGVDRLRLPRLGRPNGGAPFAARWAGVIQRRPGLAATLAGVVLLVLAAPLLGLRMSMPDASTQPRNTSGYATHRILTAGFGAGFDAPLVIVVQPAGASADAFASAVRDTPGIAAVAGPRASRDGAVSLLIAYPTTSGQSARTATLLTHLRHDVVPAAAPGSTVYIGGPTAGAADFADLVSGRLPLLVGAVVVVSMLLLVAVFRSVVLAVKAAVLNLMSIGAAYGVLVAAVQWGWLTKPLGFPGAMPIAAYVPMIMFPILFGLSMDYEVFLVAAIREEYDRIGDTRRAVTRGLARTARVITAAAAIMIAVFLSVMLGADLAVKQLGLGMAVMVFIDATLVRMVLVPAAMELFGRFNWWLPGWLAKLLPVVHVEAQPAPVS
ncbi:MAG TPA: MMPL family transporter [Micromonosporaceae bacterium]|nr:MMPL family transporter [Micromonosporaceae bacterium]